MIMWNLAWLIYCVMLFHIVASLRNATESSTVVNISANTTMNSDTEELQPPTFRESAIENSKWHINAKIGGKFLIRCGVRGKPKPVVRFYKENQMLKPSQKTEVAASFLRIVDIQPEDGGNYTCKASNDAGDALLHFFVIVDDGLPEIEEEKPPENPEVPHWTHPRKMKKLFYARPAGSTVQFRCLADGLKPLTAEWFKNGEKIEKDQRIGGYKFRHKGQMIELESAVVSDHGAYQCVISNSLGSINHTYELDIAERPAAKPILQEGLLKNVTADVGGDVTFRCKVFSDTPPIVQWLKINDSELSDVTILKRTGVNTTNAEMQTLTLRNVSRDDQGEYVCFAANAIGVSYKSAWLSLRSASDLTTVVPVKIEERTPYLLFVFGIVGCSLIIFLVLYALRNYYRNKDAPRLVPIENPDNIPPMTKMEEPLMMMGAEQTWSRMWPNDHMGINIQPDLQWEIKKEDILLRDLIDEGFFGRVYLAELITIVNGRKEKAVAALKMLKPAHTEKDAMDLLTEMDQMKRVGRHKNIINLLGVCTQNGLLWLVTEYAQQGNLRDYLRRNRPSDMHHPCGDHVTTNVPAPRSEPLSLKDLMSAAYQVARGMEYLTEKKCVHRDLAARNVLVTDDYVMKIADFGLARDIRSNDYYRKHTRGHLPYKWMALEAMMDNVFTHATDVWSFGVLLWEIFSLGGSPYPGVKTHELVRFLRQGQRLDHPQFSSMELYRLMRDCWEEKPQRRPKFRQLVEDLDRMLAESSSVDYIDLSRPIEADYASFESDESGIDEKIESSSGSSNAGDTDSVFERSADRRLHQPGCDVEDQDLNGEDDPLLDQQLGDDITCVDRVRMTSSVTSR